MTPPGGGRATSPAKKGKDKRRGLGEGEERNKGGNRRGPSESGRGRVSPPGESRDRGRHHLGNEGRRECVRRRRGKRIRREEKMR